MLRWALLSFCAGLFIHALQCYFSDTKPLMQLSQPQWSSLEMSWVVRSHESNKTDDTGLILGLHPATERRRY